MFIIMVVIKKPESSISNLNSNIQFHTESENKYTVFILRLLS